jgi:SAM-dependent methyltransferase
LNTVAATLAGVERATVAIYERSAAEYRRRRRAVYADRAAKLGADAPHGLPILDAGCGAGVYLAHLASAGHQVVGLDAAEAMLDLATESQAAVALVRGDLEALPFAPSSFGAVWARNTYVHLHRDRFPAALADLHRVLTPNGRAWISLLVDSGDDGVLTQDDLPGRYFSRWRLPVLLDVVIGAGFAVDQIDRPEATWLLLRRRDAEPDLVAAGLDAVVCTLRPDPPIVIADARIGRACVVNDRDLSAGPPLAEALERLARVLNWLAPRQVVFVGQADWASLALSEAEAADRLADVRLTVVSAPSEAVNAASQLRSVLDAATATR